ncbi:hypothetical protein CHUAL_004225 [Chamberlinius hualienensis]
MGNEHKNKQTGGSTSAAGKSSSSSAGSKQDDHELLRLAPTELVNRLHKAESDKIKLLNERGEMVKDINQRVQMYMGEIRNLKERNQKLQDDNQELRDLCCFLDDDRQKGRKLAREWQRFGRYTASVMRQEVATYQGKLHELECRQQELVKDNLDLKDLCLYLDEERVSGHNVCSQCGMPSSSQAQAQAHTQRDDGDGSSSSTNNDEATLPSISSYSASNHEEQPHRGYINEQVLQYIRSLERRIQQLEEQLQPVVPPQKPPRLITDGGKLMLKPLQPPPYRKPPCPPKATTRPSVTLMETNTGRKPEAVVHAMKVLEVYEKLEKENKMEADVDLDMAEGERALVKEMCNVVWRKLEDGSVN